uniref:Myosin tail domain-containing protein n=1 Tax=Denticeps clupeoides TaxID=299321 RepID=A0AAY4EH32_9TELE
MSSPDFTGSYCTRAQRRLAELLGDQVGILQKTVCADRQISEEREGLGNVWRHVRENQELGRHPTDLQWRTKQEISAIEQQLQFIELQQRLLSRELTDLDRQYTETGTRLQRTLRTQDCSTLQRTRQVLQERIAARAAQHESLSFREEALRALQDMLREDADRYQQEAQQLQHFSHRATNGMPGESQHHLENSMDTHSRESQASMTYSSDLKNGHITTETNVEEDEEQRLRSSKKVSSVKGTASLTRSGSVKNLIHKFSSPENQRRVSPGGLQGVLPQGGYMKRSGSESELGLSPRRAQEDGEGVMADNSVPSVTMSPAPSISQSDGTTRINGTSANLGTGLESHFDPSKQPESPLSEEEAPRAKVSHSIKYQLLLGSDMVGNGSRDADGPAGENGPRVSRWESSSSLSRSRSGPNYRGSLESLASRDWDTMSDRTGGFESPPRVFNSPYTSTVDFNPFNKIAEYKMQDVLSPVTPDYNIFGLNGRSTSPVPGTRTRFSTYDTLTKRRERERDREVITNQIPLRMGMPNKRDYIEELTKQLEDIQRRNQFLEAESIEMNKERNQIRFEMRGLLVNNEDLIRVNTQQQVEIKKLRDRMVEIESDHNVMIERFRQMEVELKEAREVMVEANTQEYAFNFLQQSLKNKIQDAEEALENQTQHSQMLSEKLWLAERRLEELEMGTESRGKKVSELNITVQRLETELAEALQSYSQCNAELNLQQKLRADSQHRVEELEESLLEKDQELQRLQQITHRLQGEVTVKLTDKERSLEEEIQLRERIQLQCKQAERHVDDLHMELQTLGQAKEDMAKQLKNAQERIIDLETDLEELHDSEQRWASKHKKAIEQTEQLQLKLIQQKDLNEQLECEKAILERQVKDLRSEIEELHNTRVQEDVISKAESKVRELENMLRAEERSKVSLTNTVNKLEKRINELTDQMEEEHRLATEQKDLLNQRIRSLKRQLNEVEEEASRKEAQQRHAQRELAEERESSQRLQKQLTEQQILFKRKESQMMRQTLDKLDLNTGEDDSTSKRA